MRAQGLEPRTYGLKVQTNLPVNVRSAPKHCFLQCQKEARFSDARLFNPVLGAPCDLSQQLVQSNYHLGGIHYAIEACGISVGTFSTCKLGSMNCRPPTRADCLWDA